MKPPGAVGTLLRALGRRDGTDTPPAPHSFREKASRRGGACAACREPLGPQGLVCRVCKVASHKRCEAKVRGGRGVTPGPAVGLGVPPGPLPWVRFGGGGAPGVTPPRLLQVTSPCQAPPPPRAGKSTAPARRSEHLGSTKSLNSTRQRSTLPRSLSLEQVMQRQFDFDLTYVTERIICLRFPAGLEEPRYRGHLREVAQMLASRHRDKYTLFNLSEKRRDIARLNPKVQDFGWPDLHAPPLDKLCSICKAMEGWLRAHPQHVAVLHCKGSKGRAFPSSRRRRQPSLPRALQPKRMCLSSPGCM
ncbi:tensin-2-like [Theristicus caerulescens]